MLRKYETMFIVKPTLSPEELKAKVEFIKDTLTKQGAEIVAVDEMGVRELAYPIEKNSRGFYCVVYYTAKPEINNELERIYRINEDILRSIIVKYEKQIEVKAWEDMVKRANGEKIEVKRISYGGARKDFNRPRATSGGRYINNEKRETPKPEEAVESKSE